MQVGSIIAYEGHGIHFAEVIDLFTFWNGEKGLRIMPFGEKHVFDIFESDAWLLADTL
jgi:hypothetical protein